MASDACKDKLRAFRRRAVPLDAAAEAEAPEPPRSEVLDAVMALPDSTALESARP